jgi:hypothetical protein
MLMSTLPRRSFTLFLLLLAASLLHPVDTTAQNLPGWAEPSEERLDPNHTDRVEKQRRNHLPEERAARSKTYDLKPFDPSSPGGLGPVTREKSCTVNSDCGGGQVCCDLGGTPRCIGKSACDNREGSIVPIDDYLPLLMLAGIAYAALRLRQ